MTYVYMRPSYLVDDERGLGGKRRIYDDCYTVGFYAPDGTWEPESDHATKEAAAARVSYLNGDASAPVASERGLDRETLARVIYGAFGWTHWPLDTNDPDADATEVVSKYLNAADAILAALSEGKR